MKHFGRPILLLLHKPWPRSSFHYESLRNRIEPLILFIGENSGAISMRLQTDDVNGFVSFLKAGWDEMAPGQPFAYNFLDERFNRMYRSEQRIGRIISLFTVLAIFIACIGLFGLATFAAQQRRNEIGIRKVLGASLSGLVGLLTKDFLGLVAIALLIAIPLAWLGMYRWLSNFAYSNSTRMVDLRCGRFWGLVASFYYGKFPVDKSSLGESCQKPEE